MDGDKRVTRSTSKKITPEKPSNDNNNYSYCYYYNINNYNNKNKTTRNIRKADPEPEKNIKTSQKNISNLQINARSTNKSRIKTRSIRKTLPISSNNSKKKRYWNFDEESNELDEAEDLLNKNYDNNDLKVTNDKNTNDFSEEYDKYGSEAVMDIESENYCTSNNKKIPIFPEVSNLRSEKINVSNSITEDMDSLQDKNNDLNDDDDDDDKNLRNNSNDGVEQELDERNDDYNIEDENESFNIIEYTMNNYSISSNNNNNDNNDTITDINKLNSDEEYSDDETDYLSVSNTRKKISKRLSKISKKNSNRKGLIKEPPVEIEDLNANLYDKAHKTSIIKKEIINDIPKGKKKTIAKKIPQNFLVTTKNESPINEIIYNTIDDNNNNNNNINTEIAFDHKKNKINDQSDQPENSVSSDLDFKIQIKSSNFDQRILNSSHLSNNERPSEISKQNQDFSQNNTIYFSYNNSINGNINNKCEENEKYNNRNLMISTQNNVVSDWNSEKTESNINSFNNSPISTASSMKNTSSDTYKDIVNNKVESNETYNKTSQVMNFDHTNKNPGCETSPMPSFSFSPFLNLSKNSKCSFPQPGSVLESNSKSAPTAINITEEIGGEQQQQKQQQQQQQQKQDNNMNNNNMNNENISNLNTNSNSITKKVSGPSSLKFTSSKIVFAKTLKILPSTTPAKFSVTPLKLSHPLAPKIPTNIQLQKANQEQNSHTSAIIMSPSLPMSTSSNMDSPNKKSNIISILRSPSIPQHISSAPSISSMPTQISSKSKILTPTPPVLSSTQNSSYMKSTYNKSKRNSLIPVSPQRERGQDERKIQIEKDNIACMEENQCDKDNFESNIFLNGANCNIYDSRSIYCEGITKNKSKTIMSTNFENDQFDNQKPENDQGLKISSVFAKRLGESDDDDDNDQNQHSRILAVRRNIEKERNLNKNDDFELQKLVTTTQFKEYVSEDNLTEKNILCEIHKKIGISETTNNDNDNNDKLENNKCSNSTSKNMKKSFCSEKDSKNTPILLNTSKEIRKKIKNSEKIVFEIPNLFKKVGNNKTEKAINEANKIVGRDSKQMNGLGIDRNFESIQNENVQINEIQVNNNNNNSSDNNNNNNLDNNYKNKNNNNNNITNNNNNNNNNNNSINKNDIFVQKMEESELLEKNSQFNLNKNIEISNYSNFIDNNNNNNDNNNNNNNNNFNNSININSNTTDYSNFDPQNFNNMNNNNFIGGSSDSISSTSSNSSNINKFDIIDNKTFNSSTCISSNMIISDIAKIENFKKLNKNYNTTMHDKFKCIENRKCENDKSDNNNESKEECIIPKKRSNKLFPPPFEWIRSFKLKFESKNLSARNQLMSEKIKIPQNSVFNNEMEMCTKATINDTNNKRSSNKKRKGNSRKQKKEEIETEEERNLRYTREKQNEMEALRDLTQTIESLLEKTRSDPVFERFVSLVTKIYSELLEQICFGIFHDVRRSLIFNKLFLIDSSNNKRSGISISNTIPILSSHSVDIFGQDFSTYKPESFYCDGECGRVITSNKYAPHLEKCIGINRRATASSALAICNNNNNNCNNNSSCNGKLVSKGYSSNKLSQRKRQHLDTPKNNNVVHKNNNNNNNACLYYPYNKNKGKNNSLNTDLDFS